MPRMTAAAFGFLDNVAASSIGIRVGNEIGKAVPDADGCLGRVDGTPVSLDSSEQQRADRDLRSASRSSTGSLTNRIHVRA